MLAEIQKKVRDDSEDRLTGNVFGALRYLPFDVGIKPVLTDAVCPSSVGDALRAIRLGPWAEHISFWRKEEEGEPDILVELHDAVILIEVKLFSWLSSDDDVDNSKAANDARYARSENQLAKYARTLCRLAKNRKKYLLLLAPQESAPIIYADVVHRKLILDADVSFGYITWQGAFDVLSRIKLDGYQKIVIDDLVKLLKIKGFAGFRNFDVDVSVAAAASDWSFKYDAEASFGFAFADATDIMEDAHYVFG